MSTNAAKPAKVAIIGASGTYGAGILARAVEIGVEAYVHEDKRGPMSCSIRDRGDFCLYCVASSEWDELAPHVSSGRLPKKN